jgi:hypothetical protein
MANSEGAMLLTRTVMSAVSSSISSVSSRKCSMSRSRESADHDAVVVIR